MKKNFDRYFSVDQAFTLLLENIKLSQKTELVPVFRSFGRVLKNDVIAQENIPRHNTSHMDGFAVKSKDIANATRSHPVLLKISKVESILGKIPNYALKKGEAYKIQTGGYMPFKSDTVIPIENIMSMDNHLIKIVTPLERGSFVYSIGSDIKRGKEILYKEQVLRAQDIGFLASIEINKVSVFKKPIVSIIPTGDELTDDIEKNKRRKEKKIVNTNSHIISYIVSKLGGISFDMGITPDDVDILKNKVKSALRDSDLILTLGGTSAGKQDIVKTTINSMNSTGVIVNKIRLDRGRVTGIAVIDKKPIIILPGPIQGALNAFFIFARPLIALFSGQTKISDVTISAKIVEDWTSRKKFNDFKKIVYVKLTKSNDVFYAKPLIGETQSISLIIKSNGYIVIPENVTNLFKWDMVQVNILPGFSYVNNFQFNE